MSKSRTITDKFDVILAIPRCYVQITGSYNSAVFLSQSVYWSNRSDGGWFYKTHQEWEAELCLTRQQQRTARVVLLGLGLLDERTSGFPPKKYFRANIGVLDDLIASLPIGYQQPNDGYQQPNDGCQQPPSTKTTSKITYTAEFDEFWAAYPRKVDKKKSAQLFSRLLKKEPAILAAILKDLDGRWQNVEPQFIPHPSTYLNGRRWEDQEKTKTKEAQFSC